MADQRTPSFAENPLSSPARVALFCVLVGMLLFTRLWDLGSKTMMHDELLFVHYTYSDLYNNWVYSYLPILHGPIMLQFQTLVFHIFGVSDYTARLGVALLGIGSFFWIFQLRHWLREPGTWFALGFYTLSPGITFFQRFFHQDSMFLFCTLWIIASLLNWWRTRSGWWLVSSMLGATALFTNKASALFVYFSIGTFVLLYLVHDFCEWFHRGKSGRIADFLERIPPFPSPWLVAGIVAGVITLIVTQVFEGIIYDGDVRQAIGHDWVLRDVRSIPLALGWVELTATQAPDAGPAISGGFWRLVYAALLLGSIAFGFLLRAMVVHRIGHAEFVVSFWRRLYANRFHFIGGICLSIFAYIWIYTMGFTQKLGVFEIYSKTWAYWGGQHEWGRIGGPFHQHGVNLLLYELPAVLLILAAWARGLFRVNGGGASGMVLILVALPVAAFHKLIFSGLEVAGPTGPGVAASVTWLRDIVMLLVSAGVACLLFPRLTRLVAPLCFAMMIALSIQWLGTERWSGMQDLAISRHGEPVLLAGRNVSLREFMEIQFNFDGGWNILLVMLLVFLATLYSWEALSRGARFHAFATWWFVTMYGSAAYAREAVPQVGIHVMLPAIILGASFITRLWELRGRWFFARQLFWPVMGLFVLWNAKATFNLNMHFNDQARERMAYGPSGDDVKNHMDFIRAYHRIASNRVENGQPLWTAKPNDLKRQKDVRIFMKSMDHVTWPAKWYLRDIAYTEGGTPDTAINEKWDFIFVAVGDDAQFPALAENYHIFRGRGTTFWTPSPILPPVLLEGWTQAIPGHYLNNSPQQERARISAEQWRLLRRYITHREYFDGTNRPWPSVSGFEYLFCVRKDLY